MLSDHCQQDPGGRVWSNTPLLEGNILPASRLLLDASMLAREEEILSLDQ